MLRCCLVLSLIHIYEAGPVHLGICLPDFAEVAGERQQPCAGLGKRFGAGYPQSGCVTVRGIARTAAQLTIRQNGFIIYQSYVSPVSYTHLQQRD